MCDSSPAEPASKGPRGPRFSLATLLLVTMVVAFGSAALGGLLSRGDRMLFVIFSAVVPVALVVLVGVGAMLVRQFGRRGKGDD